MLKKIILFTTASVTALSTSAFAENFIKYEDGMVYAFTESDLGQVMNEAVNAKIADNLDYNPNEDITREQFCEFVYNTINPIKEFPAAKLARNPFDDVSNY